MGVWEQRTDDEARARMDALLWLLPHEDPTQLWYQVFEIAGQRVYLRHGVSVGPGDVVLDVGANVGVAGAFFASQCGAEVVHCFEPVGPIFDLLRQTASRVPACVAHHKGMSSGPGRAAITYYPGASAMSGLYADPERDRRLVHAELLASHVPEDEAHAALDGRYEPEVIDCELTTISAFMVEEGLERVDLLKIDVERAELDVLAGVEETDWPRIRQVAMEVHDDNGRAAEVAAKLRGRGFRVVVDQDVGHARTDLRMLYAVRAPSSAGAPSHG